MNIITYDDPNLNFEGIYYEYNGIPYSGLIREVSNDGTILEETEIKNGFIHGYDRTFYLNGNLKIENIEFHNKTHEYKEWDISGTLIYHYKNNYSGPHEFIKTVILDNRP